MTVLNLTISSGANDGFEDGSGNVTTNDLAPIVDNEDEMHAYHFPTVNIPQGATINSATIQVYITSSATDEPDGYWWADDVDDSASITAGSGNTDVSGRTQTAATVNWQSTDLASAGGFFTAPAITTITQELVNRAGWVSGNSQTLVYQGNVGQAGTRDLGCDHYDTNSNRAAKYDIDYTAGSSARSMLINNDTLLGASRLVGGTLIQ